MSNIKKSLTAPIERAVDGAHYTFPMLKRKHLGELLAMWAAEDRAALLKNMETCKVDSAEKIKRLDELDNNTSLLAYGYQCLFEFHRSGETVLKSMQIDNPEATIETVDGLPLVPDDVVTIACELWGLSRESLKDDPEEKEDTGENPT